MNRTNKDDDINGKIYSAVNVTNGEHYALKMVHYYIILF